MMFALSVVGLPSQRESLNNPCEFNEKLLGSFQSGRHSSDCVHLLLYTHTHTHTRTQVSPVKLAAVFEDLYLHAELHDSAAPAPDCVAVSRRSAADIASRYVSSSTTALCWQPLFISFWCI